MQIYAFQRLRMYYQWKFLWKFTDLTESENTGETFVIAISCSASYFVSMVDNCQPSWNFLKVLNWFLQYQRSLPWIHFLDFNWLVIVCTKDCKLLNEYHVTGKAVILLPKVFPSATWLLHHQSSFQLYVVFEWGQTWQAFH